MMREQTQPRLRTKTPLLPGMLKRSKYSRLRNDSLTSQEDRPQRMLPLKRDLCSESDFAQLDPGTPTSHGQSTLRDFIPRVANIRLQSPMSLQGLRRRTNVGSDRTADVHPDGPLSGTDSCSGTNQRLCGQHFLSVPLSTGLNLTPSALSRTKRPVSLSRTHRCPAGEGLCCLKPPSSSEDCTLVQTTDRAVHHHIKYMGSVEVTQSMRALEFHTRIQVTQEAISRLCERASARTAVRTKRPLCKRLSAVLGRINLQFSGNRIILSVSTDCVTLIAASSSQTIAHHPMQAISFASGGDPDMADYIAYVAKDDINQRACHILECPQGRASEVINSIGQAFETHFRQLLSHPPSLLSINPRSSVRLCHKCCPAETIINQRAKRDSDTSEHGDYYNMIQRGVTPAGGTGHMRISKEEDERHADEQSVYLSQPVSSHDNCTTSEETRAPPADSVESAVSAQHWPLPSETQIQDLIQDEGWFHGRLGREQAESLLTCSGDFLVRESSSASGQYVLSSKEGAIVRHLLLVDPHGQVRTRDQVFLSVGHLVRFHMENQMPIVSGSSELCLKQPVLQRY